MSDHELNDGLAAHTWKPGEVTNATGVQGSRELRSINRDIKALFFRKGDEPCDLPRHVHQTWMEALVDTTWTLAIAGDKDARKDLMNRMFGRVAVTLDASLTVQRDPLDDLSEEELVERMERLIAIVKGQPDAIDADVVTGEQAPPIHNAGGSIPLENQPHPASEGETP
jgi:hypothetical protein